MAPFRAGSCEQRALCVCVLQRGAAAERTRILTGQQPMEALSELTVTSGSWAWAERRRAAIAMTTDHVPINPFKA